MFKAGQHVKVISDHNQYRYCIGKIGVIVDVFDGRSDRWIVQFNETIPPDPVSLGNNRSSTSRIFLTDEIVSCKEYNVKKILKYHEM